MPDKNDCPISRVLYWVSIFLEYGYSLENTQRDMLDHLGMDVTLSEDEHGMIMIQPSWKKGALFVCRSDFPQLQKSVVYHARGTFERVPMRHIKLFDEE
jgi:hypothetical protein